MQLFYNINMHMTIKGYHFFTGIGIGSTILVSLINIYYIVVLAWSLHYFFASFNSVLPWSTCGNEWNTDNCISVEDMGVNSSQTAKDSVVEYWE